MVRAPAITLSTLTFAWPPASQLQDPKLRETHVLKSSCSHYMFRSGKQTSDNLIQNGRLSFVLPGSFFMTDALTLTFLLSP